jgi:peptide/nickel transport system permease protein
MGESISPARQALRRLWSMREARIGAAIAATFALIAIYAPFLCGEVALAWWDEDGLRLPVFADLFNRRSYPKPHDLLFNLVALALPFLICGWFLLRRRWTGGRRLAVGGLLVVGAWVACQVPLLPSTAGMQPAWRNRPISPFTSAAAHEQAAEGRAQRAIFPLVPHRADTTYPGAGLKSPGTVNEATGARFWLGTDTGGRDVLAQMCIGARISLTVGIFATGLSLLIGTLLGAMSGYFGGWVDLVIQRIVEIMMCFPTFILILVVVAMLGRDIFNIMLVIGLTGWAGTARLVRGEFLGQAVRDYVVAAEALGLSRWRIMYRHILPNALTPLIIAATFGIAGAVGSESGLAFVGLGDPTSSSWGNLMQAGRENINYGWLIYAPGLAVFALITSLNLLGNALREALDPKGTR